MTDEQVKAGITVLQNDELARWVYGLLSQRYAPTPTPGVLGPMTEGGTPAPKPTAPPPFVPPFEPKWYAGVKVIDPYTGASRPANDFEFATPETAAALAARLGGTVSPAKWTSYTAPVYELVMLKTAAGKTVTLRMNAGAFAVYYRDLKSENDLKNADRKASDQIDAEVRMSTA